MTEMRHPAAGTAARHPVLRTPPPAPEASHAGGPPGGAGCAALGIGDAPAGRLRAAILAASLLVPLSILLAAALLPWEMADLLRDTVAVAAAYEPCCPPHLGALSTLGLLVMSGAAAVLATAAILRVLDRGADGGARLLGFGAAFSAAFCLDDAFLLHEHVFLHRGVPEAASVAVHPALMAATLWSGRRHLRHLEPALLALTLAGFGASVAIDGVLAPDPAVTVAEDALKFVAIFTWAGFALVAALRLSRAARPTERA